MDRNGRFRAALFCASGISGILYEVLWLRFFTSTLGSSTQSVSAIITAFLLGSGVGSYIFGRVADRPGTKTMKLYAVLELATALFAIVGFLIFFLLDGGRSLMDLLPYGLEKWLVFAVAMLLVSIPAALIGGGLPVLVKSSVSTVDGVRRSMSLLYALHTLGGVVGAIASAVLIETIGYRGAYIIAIVLTLAIGIAAWMLAKPIAAPEHKEEPKLAPVRGTAGSNLTARMILISIALSGFAALGFEVLWYRIATYILRGTLFSFSLFLAAYLTGLAIGSYLFADRAASKDERRFFATLQCTVAILALLALPALLLGLSITDDYRNVVALSILVLVTIVYGAILPVAGNMLAQQSQVIGRSVGTIYAINISGAVMGSLLTGFVLLPHLGTTVLLVAIPLINGVIGLYWLLSETKRPKALLGGMAIALSLATTIHIVFPLMQSFVVQARDLKEYNLIATHETELQMLSVLDNERGERILLGGPFISGATHESRRHTQRLQSHLALLVARETKTVLEIGYGVGELLRTILLYKPERASLVEIDPQMVTIANQYFGKINENASEHHDVQTHTMDGRRFLQRTSQTFDVVMSDSMILVSELAHRLYTAEHFRAGRDRLNPGGVMLVWVPLDSDTRVRILISTFLSVFPQSVLWVPVGKTDEAFLLGFVDEAVVDYQMMKRRFDEVAGKDLKDLGWDTPLYFLAGFRAGPDALAEIAKGVPIHSDVNPVLDFAGQDHHEGLKWARQLRPSGDISWLQQVHTSENVTVAQMWRDENSFIEISEMPGNLRPPIMRRLKALGNFQPAATLLAAYFVVEANEAWSKRRYEDANRHYQEALDTAPGSQHVVYSALKRMDLEQHERDRLVQRLLRLHPYAANFEPQARQGTTQ